MRRIDNVRLSGLKRFLVCLVAATAVAVVAAPDSVEPARPGAGTQKRHPLVVLKQTEIHGRVFFLSEEGEGDAVPARQLPVAVFDHGGRKEVHKTVTDDDGFFSLPDMDVGVYQIRIGGLTLDLSVEVNSGSAEKTIPKQLLVYMPKALEK